MALTKIKESCIICWNEAAVIDYTNQEFPKVGCDCCGEFSITGSAAAEWNANKSKLSSRKQANVYGWIRENQGIKISTRDIEQWQHIQTPSVAERAEKLLKAMHLSTPEIGAIISVENETPECFKWISSSWSQNYPELDYLLTRYLVEELGLLHKVSMIHFQISPKGYDYLERLRIGSVDSSAGFCAMWFAQEVSAAWTDAIAPAIKAAGYKPVRIDGVDHNNKIDDEILANIRRARFIVADFTGERGGVYFEAGFALGLGREVIWTVREDSLEKIHFDNRQYNFLMWNADALEDFRTKLQLRIEATIGRGPL